MEHTRAPLGLPDPIRRQPNAQGDHDRVLRTSDPAREEEYRSWYDGHISEALRAVSGMPRARRFRLSENQRHDVSVPSRFITIYEIDADDVEEVHERLMAAWENDELSKSDVISPGPVVYWDLDSEIVRD